MSDVQSRERSTETASGAQRGPDERVREALDRAARYQPVDANAVLVLTLAAEVRRLYTQAQRDDHPTEGLLRRLRSFVMSVPLLNHADEGRAAELGREIDAALAASKGTPDSMGHGQPLPSLSAVAQWQPIATLPQHATNDVLWTDGRFVWCDPADCIRRDGEGTATHWMPLPGPPKDVRSQAKDTKRDGNDQRREHDQSKDKEPECPMLKPDGTCAFSHCSCEGETR